MVGYVGASFPGGSALFLGGLDEAGRFHKLMEMNCNCCQKFQVQMNFPEDIASTKLGNHHINPIKNT